MSPLQRLIIKLLSQLVIWGSLAAGAISAATAYLVALDLPDDRLVGATLAAPAGKVEQPDGTVAPLAEKGVVVSDDLLARLRTAGVGNIRVKQFAWDRWSGRWWFGLALLGLAVGALLTRWGARPEPQTHGQTESKSTPHQIVHVLRREVDDLRSELPLLPGRAERLHAIVVRVGELQKTHLVALVDARDVLVSRLGLSGYAVLMDAFAAAERQLNRAWSAAVDKAYEEAVTCLEEGAVHLEAVQQTLGPDAEAAGRGSNVDRPE